MDDIFKEISVKEQQLIDQLKVCSIVEITGLVGVSGSSASKIGNDHLWSLTIKFDAWRVGSGNLRRDPLTVRRKVSELELKKIRKKITAETIIKIRARVSDDNIFGSPQALLEEIIKTNISDTVLNSCLEELKKPVTYADGVFGIFTFDRGLNWYRANVNWIEDSINLNLSIESNDDLNAALQTAHVLWNDKVMWNNLIRDYAVRELLSLKNESWLEEDEIEVTGEQFKDRMSLESITIYSDGSFEFWHDDGDLFWGHSILISGSLSKGLTDADIPG